MELALSRTWQALALRGIAGIVFGAIVFLWRRMAPVTLVTCFGVYAVVDGLIALSAATRQRARADAGVLGLEGLVGVAVGLVALTWVESTAHALVLAIALWALVTGALEIALGFRLRREIPDELFLFLAGAASVLLGVAMLLWPGAGALTYALFLASYALFFGTAVLLSAFRMRRRMAEHEHIQHEREAAGGPRP